MVGTVASKFLYSWVKVCQRWPAPLLQRCYRPLAVGRYGSTVMAELPTYTSVLTASEMADWVALHLPTEPD